MVATIMRDTKATDHFEKAPFLRWLQLFEEGDADHHQDHAAYRVLYEGQYHPDVRYRHIDAEFEIEVSLWLSHIAPDGIGFIPFIRAEISTSHMGGDTVEENFLVWMTDEIGPVILVRILEQDFRQNGEKLTKKRPFEVLG